MRGGISEHWIAVVLLLGYALLLLVNAWRGRAQTSTLTDYYVGGRRLSGWVVGVSFCATYASTNSYVGNAGKGYALGAPWLLFPFVMLLFTWLSWTTVAPRLREFTARLDALTLPDYLARRYESLAVGRVAAVIVLFASVLYLVAIFKGAGVVLQLFLDVDYSVAVLVTLVIVVLYTAIGGFLSVARTDVAQGLFMLLGSLLVGYFVFSRALELAEPGEGLSILKDARLADSLGWNAGMPFAVLVGIFLSGSLKLLVDPRQVSRFFALEDQRARRQGMWVAMVLVVLIQLGLFPVGVLAHLFFESVGDTDMIVPMLDSVLLVAASVFSRDLLGVVENRGIAITRRAVVGLAVVAAVIALRPPGDIVTITIFSGSLYAACFLPALFFSLHWTRGHAVAVLGSMGAGVLALVLWLASGLNVVLHEVFVGLIASMGIYLALSLWWPRPLPQTAQLVTGFELSSLSSKRPQDA